MCSSNSAFENAFCEYLLETSIQVMSPGEERPLSPLSSTSKSSTSPPVDLPPLGFPQKPAAQSRLSLLMESYLSNTGKSMFKIYFSLSLKTDNIFNHKQTKLAMKFPLKHAVILVEVRWNY